MFVLLMKTGIPLDSDNHKHEHYTWKLLTLRRFQHVRYLQWYHSPWVRLSERLRSAFYDL